MIDRQKVIKGLEHAVDVFDGIIFSPMYDMWMDATKDAIALLKAQEPVEPTQGRDDQDEDIFCCGVCGAVVGETYLGPPGECEVRDNYCPECGRAVKWVG